MSHLLNQQSKDHFKKAVKELAYISGMTNQIHYSIDDNPAICAQAVATLIKADQRDQAWKGGFTGQAEELREHIKRRAEEIGEKIREVFSQAVSQAFTGSDPDLNGDEFNPGCFGGDVGTSEFTGFTWQHDLNPHIIRPKSTTKPGKSYDEFLKEVTRKIKR